MFKLKVHSILKLLWVQLCWVYLCGLYVHLVYVGQAKVLCSHQGVCVCVYTVTVHIFVCKFNL